MSTTKNNISIDLFMAEFEKHESDRLNIINDLTVKGFRPNNYHEEWELLMPVVEKIEFINHFVEIVGFECIIYKHGKLARDKDKNILIWETEETKIKAVFKAVVEFIKER